MRVNQNILIELYRAGRHQFKRRYEERLLIHTLLEEGAEEPSNREYRRISRYNTY